MLDVHDGYAFMQDVRAEGSAAVRAQEATSCTTLE